MRNATMLFVLGLSFGMVASTSVFAKGLSPAGRFDIPGVVVKARGIFKVDAAATLNQTKEGKYFTFLGGPASGVQPVQVQNGPNTTIVVDNSLFVIPPISNTMLDFGYLQIKDLLDNNLKVCGASNNQRCGTALIRTYTTNEPGPGFWNKADGYGAPLFSGQAGAALNPVGLEVANALTLQTIAIAPTRNTVKISDFTNTRYDYQADFSDAGTGSYETNIVVEYAVAP